MDRSNLVKQFASVGLTLKLMDTPIQGAARARMRGGEALVAMVQMDIQKPNPKKPLEEIIRIYPGADTNLLQVQCSDAKLGQVVLTVKEVSTEFDMDIGSHTVRNAIDKFGNDYLNHLAMENRVRVSDLKVRKVKGGVAISLTRKTPEGKRHFLMGKDERQLFICQLPKAATTVRAAHDSLKNPTVTMAEGQLQGKTTRQGEWFFFQPLQDEIDVIEAALKNKTAILEKKVPIAPFESGSRLGGSKRVRQSSGNPHTADELVSIRVIPDPTVVARLASRVERPLIYVRGSVRHVDHETVKFASWRRVVRNMESNEGRMAGVSWVD